MRIQKVSGWIFCLGLILALGSLHAEDSIGERRAVKDLDYGQKKVKEKVVDKDAKNWLIAIGINDYIDKRLPALRFTENDAASVYEYFIKSGIVDPSRAYLLTSNSEEPELRPMRRNIKQKLDHALKYATDGSLVVVFIAAHGITGKGDEGDRAGYFVPYDGNLDDLDETSMNIAQIQEELKDSNAGRTLLIVDACRNQINQTRAVADVPPPETLFEQIKKTRGNFFIASCSDSQVAYEMEEVKHGVFTYFLLKGLTGHAMGKDGKVTLQDLYGYVRSELRNWADENTKQVMEPFINVDRWSGDPLILAFSPVILTIDERVGPAAAAYQASSGQGKILLREPTRIDAPKQDFAAISTLDQLNEFVGAAEYFAAYKGARINYRTVKEKQGVGSEATSQAFWIWHVAVLVGATATDDLSAYATLAETKERAVSRIGQMHSEDDARFARQALERFANAPGKKTRKQIKWYLKKIDKQLKKK